jgi:hypothetical protein
VKVNLFKRFDTTKSGGDGSIESVGGCRAMKVSQRMRRSGESVGPSIGRLYGERTCQAILTQIQNSQIGKVRKLGWQVSGETIVGCNYSIESGERIIDP